MEISQARTRQTVDAVVWDLDGTLIDSVGDLAAALNQLLAEQGRGPIDASRVRTMIGNGVTRLIERGFAATGKPAAPAELDSLADRFRTVYAAHATRRTQLFPGALSVLQTLADAGIQQGLCTNKPEAITRQVLKTLGLTSFFGVVVGGDTFARRKPAPELLQHCLDVLGVQAERCVMIGDSAVDVALARAVGTRAGVVAHGYARQPVETLGADFVIDRLVDLLLEIEPPIDR